MIQKKSGRKLKIKPKPAHDLGSVRAYRTVCRLPGGLPWYWRRACAGAGAEPTASAVIADILDIVRGINASPSCRVPHLGFQPESIRQLPVKAADQFESAYYLRFDVNDVAGVMSKLSTEFADQNIIY